MHESRVKIQMNEIHILPSALDRASREIIDLASSEKIIIRAVLNH